MTPRVKVIRVAPRLKRVIRKFRLPEFLGIEETTINQLEQLGLLHFFSMTPGGRAQVIFEEDVIALQEAAYAAGNIEALILQAKQKRGDKPIKKGTKRIDVD
jgi:hypothetical protein